MWRRLWLTLLLTPLVKALAWKCDALAQPDARRIHPQPIAQWGGLAIFVGVALAAFLWRQPAAARRALAGAFGQRRSRRRRRRKRCICPRVFFGCGLLMLLLGMVDDRFELSPLWKFGGQIAIVTSALARRRRIRYPALHFRDAAAFRWRLAWLRPCSGCWA